MIMMTVGSIEINHKINVQHYNVADRLPVELLQEIFTYACLPNDDEEQRFTPFELGLRECNFRSAFPLMLTHICRRWREIATSLSCIWTRIHIVGPNDGCLRLVALYLYRSGERPILDLQLHQQFSNDHWPVELVEKERFFTRHILILWLSRAQRWRKIDLRLLIEGSLDLHLIHALAFSSSPLLHVESAKLEFPGFQCENALQDTMWDAISASPVLTEAEWKYSSSCSFPSLIPVFFNAPAPRPAGLPFAQLKKLRLREITVEDVLAFLPFCTNLKQLGLGLVAAPVMVERGTTTFPLLECLMLDGDGRSTAAFLDCTSAPQLKTLKLPRLTADHTCIVRFIHRSQCFLEHIALPEYLQEGSILSILHMPYLQSVKQLDIGYNATEKLLTALLPRQSIEETLLPHLKDLAIRKLAAPDGNMLNLVHARFYSVPGERKLRVVDVRVDDAGYNDLDVQGLYEIVPEGLTLRWLGQGLTVFNEHIEYLV